MSSDEDFEKHIDSTINDEVDTFNDNNTVENDQKVEPTQTIERKKKVLSKAHLEKMKQGKKKWLEQKRQTLILAEKALKSQQESSTVKQVKQEKKKIKPRVVNNYYLSEQTAEPSPEEESEESESESEEENNYYGFDGLTFV